MREASTVAVRATETPRQPRQALPEEAKSPRAVTAHSVSLSPDLAVERDTHVTRATTSGSGLPNATPGAISYADAASCDTGVLPEGELARSSLA